MFVKGQSGNPNGRPPKGLAISDMLEEILAEPRGSGSTRRRAILTKVCDMAEAGDMRAVEFVAAYTQGKPKENTSPDLDLRGPVRLIDYGDEAGAAA